jgi:hypothetical protein
MSVMSDLLKSVKKMSNDVKSNKDLDPDGKKKLQDWFDKIEDKLEDLGPRRDLLQDQISGLKSLDDEIKDYNRDQGSLKDNGYGLTILVKDLTKKSPKAANLLRPIGQAGENLKALPDIKRN